MRTIIYHKEDGSITQIERETINAEGWSNVRELGPGELNELGIDIIHEAHKAHKLRKEA